MDRRIEVAGFVAADAEEAFAFLAQPANHRMLDTSRMIRGSVDGEPVTRVGQVFVMNMHNAIKGDHTVENHVVLFEPGRAIGWEPASPGDPPAGHLWVWRMKPVPGGCEVVHVYDWSRFTHLDAIDRLPVVDEAGLHRSVELLARAVTA